MDYHGENYTCPLESHFGFGRTNVYSTYTHIHRFSTSLNEDPRGARYMESTEYLGRPDYFDQYPSTDRNAVRKLLCINCDLENDISDLETELRYSKMESRQKISDLECELDENEDEIDSLYEQLYENERIIKDFDDKVGQLRTEKHKIEIKLGLKLSELREREMRIWELQRDKVAKEIQVIEMRKQNFEKDQEIAKYRYVIKINWNTIHGFELKELKENNKELHYQLHEARTRCSKVQSENFGYRQTLTNVQNELDKYKLREQKKVDELVRKDGNARRFKKEADEKLNKANEEIRRLQRVLKESETSYSKVENENLCCQRRLKNLQNELDTYKRREQKKLDELERKHDNAREFKIEADKKMNKANDEIKHLQRELKESEARCRKFQEKNFDCERNLKAAKDELDRYKLLKERKYEEKEPKIERGVYQKDEGKRPLINRLSYDFSRDETAENLKITNASLQRELEESKNRCEKLQFELDILKKTSTQTQSINEKLQLQRDKLEKEITQMRISEDKINSDLKQTLAEKRREIELLQGKVEHMRINECSECGYLKQKFEDERKANQKKLEELNKRLAAKSQCDKHRIEKETKEKLEKANAELKQTRHELEDAKNRYKQVELERNKLKEMKVRSEDDECINLKTRQLQFEKDSLEKEMAELRQLKKKMYSEFEQKLADKQREIEHLHEKSESMKNDDLVERNRQNMRFEDERKAHQKELDDLKSKLRMQSNCDVQQILKETKEKLVKANAELNQTRQELEEAKTRYKQVELERNKLKEMKVRSEDDKCINLKTRQLQIEKDSLEKEMAELRQLKKKMYSEFEQKLADKQREIEHLHEKSESMKNDDLVERNRQNMRFEDERKAHQKELDDLKSKLRMQSNCDVQQILKETKEKLVKANAELNQTRQELEEAKTRLSKLMGQKLTDNNPNIADLSDKNRPTKLAERYTELYDNQWTDAFETIDQNNEKDTLDKLKGLLREAMAFCQREADEQMHLIKKAMMLSEVEANIPDLVNKQLKDCRKVTGEQSARHLYKKFLSHAKQSCGPFVDHIQSYVKECFEVCWLMCLQDPPVVFMREANPGDRFNTDVYKAYTTAGKTVDFVVWPAIKLHQAGDAILCKGVAQGYK